MTDEKKAEKKLEKIPTQGMKIVLSKQVKLALQSMDPETRQAVLDEIEKLSTGEAEGVRVTEEERQRLLAEEGIDLNASIERARREAEEDEKKGKAS